MDKIRSIPIEIKFAEETLVPAGQDGIANVVQVLRVGSFKHPQYGSFEITRAHLLSFVENFGKKVRGIDLAVDYKHDSEDVAAGWIEEVFLSEDNLSLFARVKWTPNGRRVLHDKEFRYLSADFTLNYVDAETLVEFGPTLLGAGLTNRPFIKGMDPVVQLSEGENKMTLEQAMARIAELEAQLKAAKDAPAPMASEHKMLSEEDERKLAEYAEMQAKLSEYKLKEEEAEKAKKLAEKEGKFVALLSEGKACEAQREAFMSDDFMKFAELAQPVKTERVSSENGESKPSEPTTADAAEDKVLELADKLVKEGKARDVSGAISIVLSENESLRKLYETKFQ